MKITDKILRPISETMYLSVPSAPRYRTIMRFFFSQSEKMTFWLTQEEIFNELKSSGSFDEYTPELCRQDLDQLVNWKNLTAVQDASSVSTIEEFNNRKSRYQMTSYSAEIERMCIRLENLSVEGASLDPALMERFRIELGKVKGIADADPAAVHSWWDSVNEDFRRLNQNYQDYLRDMNGIKAEEMMQILAFLQFKEKLIQYLRTFIRSLQKSVDAIKVTLRSVPEDDMALILQKVVAFEKDVPRMELLATEEEILEVAQGKWASIKNWFISSSYNGSESARLLNATNEVIRKITRYASMISEMSHSGANRKDEYRRFFQMFASSSGLSEAHGLSSLIFGAEKPASISREEGWARITDDILSGVYDEPAFDVKLASRSRAPVTSTKKSGISFHTEEKDSLVQKEVEKKEQDKSVMESYIVGNILDFGALPVIKQEHRNTLLSWLSRAVYTYPGAMKTEFGWNCVLDKTRESENCAILCEDGTFVMPRYRLVFSKSRGA
ncbi:MAG: TIGR02677 family protein [Clostridiales bacterium]|nr:TIGR02677 family protein [Clostridiales bacterium]